MLGKLIRNNVKRVQNLPNTRWGRALGAVRLTRGLAPWPPLYVELALTYHCNLDCGYCYQDRARGIEWGEMTLETLRRIERGIRSSFLIRPRLYLFGGEPMLHAEFPEILRFLLERGYRLSLTTNGTRLQSTYFDAIASAHGIDNVVISLNSANLETARERVNQLVRKRVDEGMTISLNCPVELALETGVELADIASRFDGCGARFLSFQHSQSVFLHGRELDVDEVVRQIGRVRGVRTRMEITFFPNIDERDIRAYYSDPEFPQLGLLCVLPWFDVFVRPNGDVVPCDEVGEVMGNAADEPLGRIWNNERYRSFRRRVGSGHPVHSICRRCCHRRYYG